MEMEPSTAPGQVAYVIGLGLGSLPIPGLGALLVNPSLLLVTPLLAVPGTVSVPRPKLTVAGWPTPTRAARR